LLERFERAPALPARGNVLPLLLADDALRGRFRTLGILRAAGRADEKGHRVLAHFSLQLLMLPARGFAMRHARASSPVFFACSLLVLCLAPGTPTVHGRRFLTSLRPCTGQSERRSACGRHAGPRPAWTAGLYRRISSEAYSPPPASRATSEDADQTPLAEGRDSSTPKARLRPDYDYIPSVFWPSVQKGLAFRANCCTAIFR
jgi:hypothetical protein